MTYREVLKRRKRVTIEIVKLNKDIEALRNRLVEYASLTEGITLKHFRESVIPFVLISKELTEKEKARLKKALRLRK